MAIAGRRNRLLVFSLLILAIVAVMVGLALLTTTVFTEYVDVRSGRVMRECSVFSQVVTTDYLDSPFYSLHLSRLGEGQERNWQIASRRHLLQRASASFRGGRVISFLDDVAYMIGRCGLSSNDTNTVLQIAIRLAGAEETGLVGDVTYVDEVVQIHDGGGVLLWSGNCGQSGQFGRNGQ